MKNNIWFSHKLFLILILLMPNFSSLFLAIILYQIQSKVHQMIEEIPQHAFSVASWHAATVLLCVILPIYFLYEFILFIKKKQSQFLLLYMVPSTPTKKFWIFLFLFRLFNSFMTRNCVHEDEFNNLIDVAYHFVYGNNTFLSPEWREDYDGMPMRLRSILYPQLWALVLKVLQLLRIDYNTIVYHYPYIVQMVIRCIGDYYFFKLIQLHFDWNKKTATRLSKTVRIIFGMYIANMSIINWFSRPLSPNIEAIIFQISFYVWLKYWHNQRTIYLHLIAIMLIIQFHLRNTSVIIYIPLLFYSVFIKRQFFQYLKLAGFYVPVLFLINAMNDYTFYKTWTFPYLNFFKFHFIYGFGLGLSQRSKLFYFYTYLPFLCGIAYIILPIGLVLYYIYYGKNKTLTQKKENENKTKQTITQEQQKNLALKDTKTLQQPFFLWVILFYLFVYSILKHKEEKFLLPVFPFLIIMIGYGLYFFQKKFPRLTNFYLVCIIIVDLVIYNVNITYRMRGDLTANYLLEKARNNELHSIEYFVWYPFPLASRFHGFNVTSQYQRNQEEFNEQFKRQFDLQYPNKKNKITLNEFIWDNLGEYAVIQFQPNYNFTLQYYDIEKKIYLNLYNYQDDVVNEYLLIGKKKSKPPKLQ